METGEIFSIRIVVADFYMEKPKFGLDPCYSEFRGKEIKKVPIIRVFGANANGQKTCMHIHGVFPYFYIPYESKDFETLNKAMYQIATSIDKAINISLGQGSSMAQHVFKIQLVKGIPFYGYHKAEHQFLRIYMFNPRFVRRAAGLLQNGAIMGKNFHPHESHVPYILQFMIDYNLYGMSFLHVPFEIVKFRRSENDDMIPYPNIKISHILKIEVARKQASSTLEVDIASSFILNRFQLVIKSNGGQSNPGIESIWQDERLRRQKLIESANDDQEKLNAIPVLEIPPTQERPNVEIAESDTFYRNGLMGKLLLENTQLTNSSGMDETINTSVQQSAINITLNPLNVTEKEKKRTFNLRKIIGNAVYPEECSQEETLTNASNIENHLSSKNIFELSLVVPEKQVGHVTPHSENLFTDDTIVDEDLIMQNQHVPLDATLREEDLQLLDVLEQLEESNDNQQHIDLDSTLAPLSQSQKSFDMSPEQLADVAEATDEQPHDEDVNDFTIVMDDIDELLLKLTQGQTNSQTTLMEGPSIPQIDGANDLLRTPTKKCPSIKSQKTPKSTRCINQASPSRSPRTPKASRYRPLPIVITRKSEKKDSITNSITENTPTHSTILNSTFDDTKRMPVRKKLALSEKRRKTICTLSELEQPENQDIIRPVTRSSRKAVNMDKTHITCALMPRRKSERLLKTYKLHEATSIKFSRQVKPISETSKELKNEQVVLPKSTIVETNKNKGEIKQDEKIKLRNLRVRVKRMNFQKKPAVSQEPMEQESLNISLECKKLSESLRKNAENSEFLQCISKELNDEVQNFSRSDSEKSRLMLYDNEDEVIEASDTEQESSILSRRSHTAFFKRLNRHRNTTKKQRVNKCDTDTHSLSGCSKEVSCQKSVPIIPKTPPSLKVTENEDWKIHSFYEKSFTIDSPSMFSDVSSPGFQISEQKIVNNEQQKSSPMAKENHSVDRIIIAPVDLPPTYDEVIEGCKKFNIPEFTFPRPHYSNPDDKTKQKEIGFLILDIPGNKLNDCEEFRSVLGSELNGINSWRRKKLVELGGPELLNRYKSSQSIRYYLASNNRIVIEPHELPPTVYDAKLWIKAREMLKSKLNKDEVAKSNNFGEDSPIKVRRQKVTMMLNDDTGNGDGDEDLDSTALSLTLTPVTPHTPVAIEKEKVNQTFTPLTTHSNDSAGFSKSKSRRSLKRDRSGRARLSLSKKLLTAIEKSIHLENKIKIKPMNQLLVDTDSCKSVSSSQSEIRSSQSSDITITSDVVCAEMERSSFIKNLQSSQPNAHEGSFGLSSATLDNTFGFKVNLENLQQAKSDIEYNYLTTITMEVFVPTRDDLFPDPMYDQIRCIFYAIDNSIPMDKSDQLPMKAIGYIIVCDPNDIVKEGKIHGLQSDVNVEVVNTEIEALQALLELCRQWDPDIFAGYEIEMSSWGYIIDRAKYLNLDLAPLLSRVPSQKAREFVDEERETLTDLDVESKLCGRILLDVWRLMRSEIALTSYTFENVMYHIMHKRCPCHSYSDLTKWFASPCSRWIVLEYYLERVRGTLGLFEQLDLIGRTSEMAKLMGIQFYEVLSRGSQFRVESMMLRIAKPKNLVPLSPSVQQRAHMRAPEYLPLILEPHSRLYVDPVIVLDFQSLYPSMIIAYNYCFSTCLGRVEHLGSSTPFEFGASQLKVPPQMLRDLLDRDLVTISPCGVVFVKPSVREGILPRMLAEILDTRQMVKQSMKLHKTNTALQRILHSRQLGLKLMANVTYGYTAANFSGRMPCVEVGDSVVAKGRETLERAIKLVEANDQWNVKVVYGDTDSLFVQVPGRSRAQAFKIGEEIAEAVTKLNPQPVKLKLEKVYQPCILQTKKRYVGFMYESADQDDPVYEAKGIETVRRDGCPAVAKMLEKVLRILFATADVSQVKEYVCRQFTKLLSGRANLQDLIFAKEFRGLNGYKPTACVPALELTRKWIQTDPRRIPRRGERVPFIITNGPPGVPLIRMVRHPHDVLSNEGLKINAIYYITKAIIPPLNRCLLLIGADVNDWFTNLPRKILKNPALSTANEVISTGIQLKKSTISQYFSTTNCIIGCGRQTKRGICSICELDKLKVATTLFGTITKIERSFQLTQQICQSCCGRVGDLNCRSLDCPVLYVFEMKRRELQQIPHIRSMLDERLSCRSN